MKKLKYNKAIIKGTYINLHKESYYFSNSALLIDLLIIPEGHFKIYDIELKNKIINLDVKVS
jgi:hypothetical protein